MRISANVKEKKDLTRRKYLKLQINIYKEREMILEQRLEDTKAKLQELWNEFSKLEENKDG